MSRRRRPPGPPSDRARAGGHRVAGGALVATLALALALVIALAPRSARRPPPAPSQVPLAPSPALADSVNAAEARGDWVRALGYLQRVADANPRNPIAVMALGMSWSNYSWGGSTYARPRPAMRTSLDRVRILRHALALEDSASALASAAHEQALVRIQWGRMLEAIGMPIDALALYQEARRLDPADPDAAAHVRTTEAWLRDPRHAEGSTLPASPHH